MSTSTIQTRVREALAALEEHSSKRVREEMSTRYGIVTPRAFGVRVGDVQAIAKRLGRDHELALALWETGWYEARLLTAYVDEPARVTAAQMDRWVKDFDNWGIVDTLCFALWDRTPHAWSKVARWCPRKPEFERRAGFALLACLALHDRATGEAPFLDGLARIERGAADDRNFVRKGVSWALRSIGRRGPVLRGASIDVARRLAESADRAARTTGKEALRDFGVRVASRARERSATARPKRAKKP